MALNAESSPSCSKMNAYSQEELTVNDTIINKFPVVMLTKLDLDTISVKVNAEDMKLFEKKQAKCSAESSQKTATKKSEVKKSSWSDDDANLSDVSVSMSDVEESVKESPITRSTGKKVNNNKNHNSGQGSSRQQSRLNKHKPSRQSEDDASTIKKPRIDDTVEKIISYPAQSLKSPPDKKFNKNARYKLYLSPFTESALESEAFRKLINLATDCVVSFSKKKSDAGSMNGNVELFFGDYLTLEQAMHRLVQLRVFPDKSVVRGSITCLEIKPTNNANNKNQWKASFSAKLFFQLNTEKREKLEQLISNKGRKKEDTSKKCVQLPRIPSSVNEEMLSLLFPFSVGVKISETGSSEKDMKGPVEIEFESQEWLDGVLACFKDFGVSTNKAHDSVFTLDVGNTTLKGQSYEKPAAAKINERKKLVPGSYIRGGVRGRFPGRNFPHTRNILARNSGPFNQRVALGRIDQRRRLYPGAGLGTRGLMARGLLVKAGRLDNARDVARAGRIDSEFPPETDNDAIRQIGHSRGLGSNNPGVRKVLEMTAQLEKLQTLAMHQRAEATSLGFVGLPGQQVVAKRRALALKQAQEGDGARRFQAAVRSRVIEGDNRLQRLDIARRREEEERIVRMREEEERMARRRQEEEIIQRRREEEQRRREEEERMARRREEEERIARRREEEERIVRRREEEERIARRREEEERIKQDEYLAAIQRQEMIARRRKQIHEFELVPRPRESQKHPKIVSNYGRDAGDLLNLSTILPYGHAPATSGLLGAAPLSTHGEASVGREKHPRQRNQVSGPPALMDRLRSPQAKQAFSRRVQDIRKTQDITEGKSRQSRWNTEREVDYGPNVTDQHQVDPARNDDRLDFNRPQSKFTTEQLFRQDIERTRVAAVTGRSLKPKPLLQTGKPLLEGTRDRQALPVQFGKNAVKKVSKDLSRERRNVEINQNLRNARNNADSYVGASGDSWESAQSNNREEVGDRLRGLRRGLGDGLLELPRSAVEERGRQFPKGQNYAGEPNNGFEAQLRASIQDQAGGRGVAVREHKDQSWKSPRRQGFSEHYQEPQDYYQDGSDGYEKQNPKDHFADRAGGYRGAQYNEETRSYDAGPTARSSYTARDEERMAGYKDSGNYTSESAFGVYQASGVSGAGRGASRGEVGANRRGGPAKRNDPAHGPGWQVADGRGLLEVPEELKHLNPSYYGEESRGSRQEAAGGDLGHFQQYQNKSRDRKMVASMAPPPMPPPLLGHRSGVNFY